MSPRLAAPWRVRLLPPPTARTANAGGERLPGAAVRHERRLEAVSCKALFGQAPTPLCRDRSRANSSAAFRQLLTCCMRASGKLPSFRRTLSSVQREQIDTVDHGILSQPGPLPFGCRNRNQQRRRFQGPPRHARGLGHNGIQQTLIISVVLDHEDGPYLGPTARGTWVIDQHDVTTLDVDDCLRGSRSL